MRKKVNEKYKNVPGNSQKIPNFTKSKERIILLTNLSFYTQNISRSIQSNGRSIQFNQFGVYKASNLRFFPFSLSPFTSLVREEPNRFPFDRRN